MKLILKIAAGVILAVIVLVVGIAACTGAALDKAAKDISKKQTWTVRVTAPAGDRWSGAIGGHSVDGKGSKTLTLRDNAVTAADLQKQTDGRWRLSMTLLKDGKKLDSNTTTAVFGVVSVSGADF